MCIRDRYSIAANRPMVFLEYRNHKGIEDYWTYHTVDADNAGTAYINDYSGNLVFIHGDMADTGLRMPLALSHVYNSGCLLYTSSFVYPPGFPFLCFLSFSVFQPLYILPYFIILVNLFLPFISILAFLYIFCRLFLL